MGGFTVSVGDLGLKGPYRPSTPALTVWGTWAVWQHAVPPPHGVGYPAHTHPPIPPTPGWLWQVPALFALQTVEPGSLNAFSSPTLGFTVDQGCSTLYDKVGGQLGKNDVAITAVNAAQPHPLLICY